MVSLESQLGKARPPLHKIAPLTSYICWCYVLSNLLIGVGMIFLYNTTIPLAVANILTYGQWGIVFLGMAILATIGLLTNNWNLTRNTQLLGIAIKATWSIALIVRCITAPQTILITVVWLFLVAVQVGLYIYFLPPRINNVR